MKTKVTERHASSSSMSLYKTKKTGMLSKNRGRVNGPSTVKTVERQPARVTKRRGGIEGNGQRSTTPQENNGSRRTAPFVVSDILHNQYLVLEKLKSDSKSYSTWLVIRKDLGVFKELRVYSSGKIHLAHAYVYRMEKLIKLLGETPKNLFDVTDKFYVHDGSGANLWYCLVFDFRVRPVGVDQVMSTLVHPDEGKSYRKYEVIRDLSKQVLLLIKACHEKKLAVGFKVNNVFLTMDHGKGMAILRKLIEMKGVDHVGETSNRKLTKLGNISRATGPEMALSRFETAMQHCIRFENILKNYEVEGEFPTVKVELELQDVDESDFDVAKYDGLQDAFDFTVKMTVGKEFLPGISFLARDCFQSREDWAVSEMFFVDSFLKFREVMEDWRLPCTFILKRSFFEQPNFYEVLRAFQAKK